MIPFFAFPPVMKGRRWPVHLDYRTGDIALDSAVGNLRTPSSAVTNTNV